MCSYDRAWAALTAEKESEGARNDPLSSGEDAADDIIQERMARSRERVTSRIVDSVPEGHVCEASRRQKGAELLGAREEVVWVKAREERSAAWASMAEAEAIKLEGQGDLGRDGASSTQLALHTSQGRRKDVAKFTMWAWREERKMKA
jgi:hypothetical protein